MEGIAYGRCSGMEGAAAWKIRWHASHSKAAHVNSRSKRSRQGSGCKQKEQSDKEYNHSADPVQVCKLQEAELDPTLPHVQFLGLKNMCT